MHGVAVPRFCTDRPGLLGVDRWPSHPVRVIVAGAGGCHRGGNAGAAVSGLGGGAWLGTAIMTEANSDVDSAGVSNQPSRTRRGVPLKAWTLRIG